MELVNSKIEKKDSKPNQKYKYQSTRFYDSITGKWNDIRVKKEDADKFKELGRSGIPAWLILDRVMRVINRYPQIREEILKEEE